MNKIYKSRLGKLLVGILAIAAISLMAIYPALAAPPDNDELLNATIIPGVPFTEGIDTSEATVAPDDPWPSCNYYQREATVWYQFTPEADMLVQASTEGSDYATNLAVYAGDTTYEVACSTWSNSVSFQANAGNTYYIMVAAMEANPYPYP